jgi:nitrite reductase (cytochrome c-552)
MTLPIKRRKHLITVAVAVAAGGIVAALTSALLLNIMEHKQEAKNPFFQVVNLDDSIDDPAVWGKNFPAQYDSYRRTVDQVRTRYGGSEAVPRTPSAADPRSVVSQSRLEEDPRLKRMWAGYAFSKDFREERGHAFMLEDQTYTERQKTTAQPGACLNCHASTYKLMKELGNGDLFKGFHAMNSKPYFEVRSKVQHPVSCIDCHDPRTMELRITKPAFIEGIRQYKASIGVPNYDVNRMATHQEKRAFVCGQCHVEYYFKGSSKQLTYPWSKGLKADEILSYYRENEHKDWIHEQTGAPVLKAQHPEFEMWNQGIHARSGVSCTDCHMPFRREGAQKITDHHVRSPLLNIQRACQTCHRWPESELRARVEQIQGRTHELRGVAMNALIDLIDDLEPMKSANTPSVEQARQHQREAQFLLDFVEAENSSGFHAPQEAARLLGLSIDSSRKGQTVLRKPKR